MSLACVQCKLILSRLRADINCSQEHEVMGVVANSFSYVKMFGKLCEVQFFKHSLNVCGLSRGRIESHLAFQTWNSSSMIPALSKSLP